MKIHREVRWVKKEKLEELKKAIEEGNKELGWDGSKMSPHIFYDYKIVTKEEEKKGK